MRALYARWLAAYNPKMVKQIVYWMVFIAILLHAGSMLFGVVHLPAA